MAKSTPSMRFFPHEWGGTDEEADATKEAYERFTSSLGAGVGAKIHAFAWSQSLNDSYLDRLRVVTDKAEIELSLISGDLQVGYCLLKVSYKNAKLEDRSIAIKAMNFRSAEVRYDEFDLYKGETGAKFVHRLLLWPKPLKIIEISFDDFEIAKTPLDTRGYLTYDLIFEEVQSTNED